MQKFDPVRYPNIAKLNERVKALLSSERARDWETPRVEWEISHIHPIYWMETYGKIRPGTLEVGEGVESPRGGVIPFMLNPPQVMIADRICAHFVGDTYTRVQMIILKHRKVGVSTLIAAFDYWHMRFMENIWAFAIADLASHTDNIVEMITTFQQNDRCGLGAKSSRFLPLKRVPMTKNKKGLRLSNGSIVEQDSGENSNPGTSGTLNVCHMSENAKWRDPLNAETSLFNSIPRQGYAFVVKESTAYGINKYAQDCEDAQAGKSNWEFIFNSWLEMPDCEDPTYPSEQLELSPEEKELMKTYPEMRVGHVKFRRRQIDDLGSPDTFRQDFPLNPREPFLITGSNFFNTKTVQDRIDRIKFYHDWKVMGLEATYTRFPDMIATMKYHPRGIRSALAQIEDDCVIPQIVEFTDNNDGVSHVKNPHAKMASGAAKMFKEPIRGHKYVVSVDVAEGKRRGNRISDDSIIEVVDAFTFEQVLEWGGTFDEEVTAQYAVMIAKSYNDAIIVPEMNNKCGGTLWSELQKLRYKNLYHRQIVVANKVRREEGWETRAGIKKEVCADFRIGFKNGDFLIHSLDLLDEMLYFIDAQGKLEGADGHTDDRISATTIAFKVVAITPQLRAPDRGFFNKSNDLPTTLGELIPAGMSDNEVRRYMR